MRLRTQYKVIQMLKWYRSGMIGPHPLDDEVPYVDPPHEASSLDDVARWHIARVIRSSPTLKEAADRLGMSQRNLYDKRKEYGLD